MPLLLPLVFCSFALIVQSVFMIVMAMRYRRWARHVIEHNRDYAKNIIDSNDRLMRETIKLLPKEHADAILGNWELGRAAAQMKIDRIGKDVHKRSDDFPTNPV